MNKQSNSAHAFLPQIALVIGLLCSPTILLIAAAPTNTPQAAMLTPTLGNYPDTSVGLSDNTGVTPDAVPTNTTRINVSTSTDFKGVLEGDPATGVVRVTDAYPAGTYTVTITAFDSGGASAATTFTLTVTTPATCEPVSFAPAVNLSTEPDVFSVAVGDFNRDGNQDLVVGNAYSTNVSVLLGNGDGTFSAATSYAADNGPLAVAVGDFNGDGKQDLATANLISHNVSILLGDGSGRFGAPRNFATFNGSYPISVAVGDFNGDGRQDLAVANRGAYSVSILLGNGDGTFGAATNFPTGGDLFCVVVGDFNGDGKQDLAVANFDSIDHENTVSVLLGDGAGHFSAPTNFAVGNGPVSIAVGDFNGDDKQDLAVANLDSNNVSILLGDGAGNFSAPTNLVVGTYPGSVTIGDFNGDGKQDLAVANGGDYPSFNGTVSILLGNGAGGFSAAINFAAGRYAQSVAVGDFDGDGKQDFAVANFDSSDVSILLRDCTLTPTNAVSRKTLGRAGTFDIDLPLTGNPGIECRTTGGTNDYTMIVSFSNAVTVNGSPQAQITSGTGMVGSGGVSNGGTVTINANSVTIPLTNVADGQTINVTLFGVNGSGDVIIPMGVLVGDVNEDGVVNAADLALTKLRMAEPIDETNFRSDVNANGAINAADGSIIKSNIGNGLSIGEKQAPCKR
jgi:hypothetical protein